MYHSPKESLEKAGIPETQTRDLGTLNVQLPDGRYVLHGSFIARAHKTKMERTKVYIEVKDHHAWERGCEITVIGPIMKAVTVAGVEMILEEKDGVLQPVRHETALIRLSKPTQLEEIEFPLNDGMYILSGGPFVRENAHGRPEDIVASRTIGHKACIYVVSGKQVSPQSHFHASRNYNLIVAGDILSADPLPLQSVDINIGSGLTRLEDEFRKFAGVSKIPPIIKCMNAGDLMYGHPPIVYVVLVPQGNAVNHRQLSLQPKRFSEPEQAVEAWEKAMTYYVEHGSKHPHILPASADEINRMENERFAHWAKDVISRDD